MPQVVTVFGRAGIGKSRLVRELFKHAERLIDQPVTWRTGRCPPFGENVAFAALADIVKAEAGILDTDTAAGRAAAHLGRRRLVRAGRADRPHRGAAAAGRPSATKLPPEEAESGGATVPRRAGSPPPNVLVFETCLGRRHDVRASRALPAPRAGRAAPSAVHSRPELIDRERLAGTSRSITITLPPLRNNGMRRSTRTCRPGRVSATC